MTRLRCRVSQIAASIKNIILFIRRFFADGSFAGQFDFAARIDGEYFDEDLFAFLEDVGDVLDAALGEFGKRRSRRFS